MTRREELTPRERLRRAIDNMEDTETCLEVLDNALLQVERECWEKVFDRVDVMVRHFDEHEEVKAYAMRMRDWCREQKEGL